MEGIGFSHANYGRRARDNRGLHLVLMNVSSSLITGGGGSGSVIGVNSGTLRVRAARNVQQLF